MRGKTFNELKNENQIHIKYNQWIKGQLLR